MRALLALFFGLSIFGAFSVGVKDDNGPSGPVVRAVQSDAYLVYRAAALRYLVANPAVNGAIADALLPLPPGFVNRCGCQFFAQAGVGYISAPMSADLQFDVIEREGPPLVSMGVNQGGVLVSPIYGNTGQAIPAAVANGRLVSLVRIN